MERMHVHPRTESLLLLCRSRGSRIWEGASSVLLPEESAALFYAERRVVESPGDDMVGNELEEGTVWHGKERLDLASLRGKMRIKVVSRCFRARKRKRRTSRRGFASIALSSPRSKTR